MKKLLVITASMLAATHLAIADAPDRVSEVARTRVAVDWNVGMLPFAGFGAVIGVRPATLPHLRFGVGGFRLTLPEFGLDENRGMGWHVVDRAVMAETRYYLRAQRGGAYGGLIALYQQRDLSLDTDARTRLHQYIVAAQLGYEWFPFTSHGFYIAPNFTFAARLAETGTPSVNGMTFVEKRYLPLPGINFGWLF